MKVVVHILYQNEQTGVNLFKNKNLFTHDIKHVVITDYTDLNKNIFKDFEQVFYYKTQQDLYQGITNVIDFLKSVNYTEIILSNSNKLLTNQDLNFLTIDELIGQLSIVNNIVNI